MFKFLAKVATLGMYKGGDSDLETVLKDSMYLQIRPMFGVAEKEILKELKKILGKNFENVLTDIDGMFFMAEQLSFEDIISRLRNGYWCEVYIIGGKTQYLNKCLDLSRQNKYKYFQLRGDTVNRLPINFMNYTLGSYSEYLTKSGDTKSPFPKDCPNCKLTFFKEFEDEEGDEVTYNIEADGSCERCGIHVVDDMLKGTLKIHSKIRAFEAQKGIKILPSIGD